MTQLLNIHNFHSNKNNKDYTVIQVIRDLYPSEVSNGYLGIQKCEEIFLPDAFTNKLTSSDVGKNLDLIFQVENGKAVLCDIKIK